MLRDPLTDAQKPQVKGRRPLVMLLVAGACCLALGLIGFQSSQVRQPIADEAMQLDAEDAALSKNFYQIVDKCSNWFAQASKKLAARQNSFLGYSIAQLQAEKKPLLMNAREEYGAVKNQLFDILDTIRDAQLNIESAEKRINRYMSKMGRYLKKSQWKWQSKWSTKVTRSCNKDQDAVTALIEKIDQQYVDLAKLMSVMAKADAKHVQGKLAATDCTKYATREAQVTPEDDPPTEEDDEVVEAAWYSTGKKSTTTDSTDGTDVKETKAERFIRLVRERAHREHLRKQNLKRCHHTVSTLKARVKSVKNETKKVTMKWQRTKSIHVTPFSASLAADMKKYDHDAKVALRAGRNMVGTEQADAKAENAHAQKVSKGFLDDAKAAGKENFALKNKMIE